MIMIAGTLSKGVKIMDETNALADDGASEDESEQQGSGDPGYETEQEAQEVGDEGMGADEGNLNSIQKRIHSQARKHRKETRELHDRIAHLESMRHAESANPENFAYNTNPYPSPGQPSPPGMSEEEKIHHAVRLALGMKDHEERQVKEAHKMAQVHKEYERLNDEFDNASEKYDDFDDVVRGSDVPFTKDMRDVLLLLENPAEVAYKLGKNRKELERISELHPISMAREMNKLSHALMSGKDTKTSSPQKAPMGSIRTNPSNSSTSITGKTSPSVIRQRMKAGTWK